jgi:hypothetical protein
MRIKYYNLFQHFGHLCLSAMYLRSARLLPSLLGLLGRPPGAPQSLYMGLVVPNDPVNPGATLTDDAALGHCFFQRVGHAHPVDILTGNTLTLLHRPCQGQRIDRHIRTKRVANSQPT